MKFPLIYGLFELKEIHTVGDYTIIAVIMGAQDGFESQFEPKVSDMKSLLL